MSFANGLSSANKQPARRFHQSACQSGQTQLLASAGSVLVSVFFLFFLYGGLATWQGSYTFLGGNSDVAEAIMAQNEKMLEQSRAANGTSKAQCMALMDEHGLYDADEHASLKAAMAEDRRQRIRVSSDDRDALKILEKLQRCSFRAR